MAGLFLVYPSPPGRLLAGWLRRFDGSAPAVTPRQALLALLWSGGEPSAGVLRRALSAPLSYPANPFGPSSTFHRDSERSPLDALGRQLLTCLAIEGRTGEAMRDLFAQCWASLSQALQTLRDTADKDYDERALQALRGCLRGLQAAHPILEGVDAGLDEERLGKAGGEWARGCQALEKLALEELAQAPTSSPALNGMWHAVEHADFWPVWEEWLARLRPTLLLEALPHLGAADEEYTVWTRAMAGLSALHGGLAARQPGDGRVRRLVEELGGHLEEVLLFLEAKRLLPEPTSPLQDMARALRRGDSQGTAEAAESMGLLCDRARQVLREVNAPLLADALGEIRRQVSRSDRGQLEHWLGVLERARQAS